jgi:hypothetical protein
MRIHAVLEASQDGRNWTILAYDPPIPLALLAGYQFVRPALVYATESGDELRELTPRRPEPPPPA